MAKMAKYGKNDMAKMTWPNITKIGVLNTTRVKVIVSLTHIPVIPLLAESLWIDGRGPFHP